MTEDIECPICGDIFGLKEDHIRAPKILKCGDSICKECLEKIMKETNDDYILCPTCGKQNKKKKNIDKYTTNKGVISVINSCYNLGINQNQIQNKDEGY